MRWTSCSNSVLRSELLSNDNRWLLSKLLFVHLLFVILLKNEMNLSLFYQVIKQLLFVQELSQISRIFKVVRNLSWFDFSSEKVGKGSIDDLKILWVNASFEILIIFEIWLKFIRNEMIYSYILSKVQWYTEIIIIKI